MLKRAFNIRGHLSATPSLNSSLIRSCYICWLVSSAPCPPPWIVESNVAMDFRLIWIISFTLFYTFATLESRRLRPWRAAVALVFDTFSLMHRLRQSPTPFSLQDFLLPKLFVLGQQLRRVAMINDIRAIRSSYKIIAYIMIFLHIDRLRTVHDDIQTVKIDIQ